MNVKIFGEEDTFLAFEVALGFLLAFPWFFVLFCVLTPGTLIHRPLSTGSARGQWGLSSHSLLRQDGSEAHT